MRTHLDSELAMVGSYIQLQMSVSFTDLTQEEFDSITCSDALRYLKEYVFREARLIEDRTIEDQLPM
jgi:hypothetical protein